MPTVLLARHPDERDRPQEAARRVRGAVVEPLVVACPVAAEPEHRHGAGLVAGCGRRLCWPARPLRNQSTATGRSSLTIFVAWINRSTRFWSSSSLAASSYSL